MLAGTFPLHAMCLWRDLLGCLLPARQVARLDPETPCWTPPSSWPCRVPSAAASPVEVLKKMRRRWFLWCPKCRAIWVIDRPPSLTDSVPHVIAHAMRRPL